MNHIAITVFPTILLSKSKILPAFLWRKVLKFDLGHVVMTVVKPITSQHFETTLSQNNAVSNAIKRDHWIAIIVFYFVSYFNISIQIIKVNGPEIKTEFVQYRCSSCLQTFFCYSNMPISKTKNSILILTTNRPLNGTLISIDDVMQNIATHYILVAQFTILSYTNLHTLEHTTYFPTAIE